MVYTLCTQQCKLFFLLLYSLQVTFTATSTYSSITCIVSCVRYGLLTLPLLKTPERSRVQLSRIPTRQTRFPACFLWSPSLCVSVLWQDHGPHSCLNSKMAPPLDSAHQSPTQRGLPWPPCKPSHHTYPSLSFASLAFIIFVLTTWYFVNSLVYCWLSIFP